MVGNILAVGLMSLGMGMSGVKDEPQMYAQNAETYTITYENAEDWEDRADTVYEWLYENNYRTSTLDGKLSVTGTINFGTNNNLTFMYANSDIIYINTSSIDVNYNVSTKTWSTSNFQSLSVTSQTYYEGLVETPSMGDSIIGSIASGLGLIGALATEFLAGFGALFYDSGALTPFAIFSLVMLGVAVSFAIVKLVLALIRSNTGA